MSKSHTSFSIRPPSLEEVLSQTHHVPPFTLSHFQRFLKRAHCDENLDFLMTTVAAVRTNDLAEWNDVYDEFIKDDSPREVNLPYTLKERFRVCYPVKPPPKEVVEESWVAVKGLLSDAYMQFCSWVRRQLEDELHRKSITVG